MIAGDRLKETAFDGDMVVAVDKVVELHDSIVCAIATRVLFKIDLVPIVCTNV